MNPNVLITCAVTVAGDGARRSPHLPVTPRQIAEAVLEIAKAGTAIGHIHVRTPETGKASRALPFHREVVHWVRDTSTDSNLDLTAGMGPKSPADRASICRRSTPAVLSTWGLPSASPTWRTSRPKSARSTAVR